MNPTDESNRESTWQIRAMDGPQPPVVIELQPRISSEMTLGRDPDNDIVVPGEQFPYVSAHHARLLFEGKELILEDLGSKNGTLVGRRRVTRHRLRNGEILQLGEMGPRFLATRGSRVDDTLALESRPADESWSAGSTMLRVRRALGVPRGKAVGDLLRARTHKQVLIATLVLLVAGTAVVAALVTLQGRAHREVTALRELTDGQRLQLERRLQEADQVLDKERKAWRDQRDSLLSERKRLRDRLENLEKTEASSLSEITGLTERLTETSRKLASYDPLNLEEARLREVSRVARAIVLVEISVVYRDRDSGHILYIEPQPGGGLDLNMEARGEPLRREATGSGFCVSPEGWIITNAHVVHPAELLEPLHPSQDVLLLPEPAIDVVFTGTSTRYEARVVRLTDQDQNDLALIKIAPFEGMPTIDTLDPDFATPPTGSDVFLYGFPLGKQALQAGDVVIASTFRGILSRVVDPYLQVDAGVHPGNSGGPVTDSKGHILGIVTGVQNTPEGLQTAIGYVLPVANVHAIWPPPEQ